MTTRYAETLGNPDRPSIGFSRHRMPSQAVRFAAPIGDINATASSISEFQLLALGLDQAGTALMIVTDDGLVRHLNPAARDMLRRGPIFSIRNNKLHTRRGDEAAMIVKTIRRVGQPPIPQADSPSAIVNLRGREGTVVASLSIRSLTPRGLTGAIILRVADFLTHPEGDAAWISDVFGLTPTEGRIASGLLEGLNIAAIALRESSAVETVRGHVKRAMAKVGVCSQSRFVSVLIRAHAALINPDAGCPGDRSFAGFQRKIALT